MINVCKYRDGLWPAVAAASDETGADLDMGVDFTKDEIYCGVRRPSDGGDRYDNCVVPHAVWEDAIAAKEWMISFIKGGPFCQKTDGRCVSIDQVCALRDASLPGMKDATSSDIEFDIRVDFKKHELQVQAWCFTKKVWASRPIKVPAIQAGDYNITGIIDELKAEIAAKEIAA